MSNPVILSKSTTTVRTTHRLELNSIDIVALLTAAGYVIPHGTRAYVWVPGGGDWWSNTELAVGPDAPVVLQWETVE